MSDWEHALAVARARRNLAERDVHEAVIDAVGEGAAAADVAQALRITRQDAEALLARIEHERGPDGRLAEDPYVLAERYAVGELSRDELIRRLIGWTYAPEKGMRDWDDIGVTPAGAFSGTVGRALREGLIDGETYDAIRLGRRGAS